MNIAIPEIKAEITLYEDEKTCILTTMNILRRLSDYMKKYGLSTITGWDGGEEKIDANYFDDIIDTLGLIRLIDGIK